MSIEIKNVTRSFGDFKAVKDVTLEIPAGELVALMGPSGSGKTTLLRMIAGLETPDAGSIHFHGKDATDQHVRDRRVGFVFQHYALFKHMSVFENVAFGLRVRPKKVRPSDVEIKKKVDELLKLVLLERMANRYPSQLSGGQRQRVALARALAVEPNVLLLDEPFGALDAKVRKELRRWLRKLHDELHVTSVFVTHDQEEALEVADRVVVMNEGKIEQVGTSDEVYHHPANSFVYHFLGHVNLFHGRVEGDKAYVGDMQIELPKDSRPDLKSANIYVRPHELDIDKNPAASSFRAKIIYLNTAGSAVQVELTSDAAESLSVIISHERYRELGIKKGDEVYIRPKDIKTFPDDFSI